MLFCMVFICWAKDTNRSGVSWLLPIQIGTLNKFAHERRDHWSEKYIGNTEYTGRVGDNPGERKVEIEVG